MQENMNTAEIDTKLPVRCIKYLVVDNDAMRYFLLGDV